MKILIIHRTLGMLLGGGEMFFVRLIEQIKEQKINIDLLVGKPLFLDVKYKYNFLNINYIRSPYLWNLAQIHLSRYLAPIDYKLFEKYTLNWLKKNSYKYDIIVVYAYHKIAYKIKKIFNKKVVFVTFGKPNKETLFYSKQLDAIVTNGDVLSYFKVLNNIYNIPVGIDYNYFIKVKTEIRKKYNIKKDDFVLLYVGRIAALKNIPFLIDCFNEFNKNISNSKLLIVGTGPFFRNIKIIASKNSNIIMTGYVSSNELNKYYSAADVFTLLSKYECDPLVIHEAKSCSLPIIATKVGGIKNIIRSEKGGFLIDNNIQQFVSAATELYNNLELRKEMSKYNRNDIINNSPTWNKSANKFIELCRTILK